MLPKPSIDDLIEGVQASLQADVLPALENPRAQAMLMIAQGILQMVRQVEPIYDANLVIEHNGMIALYGQLAAAIPAGAGGEAAALRSLAAGFAAREAVPAPPSREEVERAHVEMTEGLVQAMRQIDVIQRAGDESGDRLLSMIRAHVAPRVLTDVQAYVVGAGMVGRG